jgi:polyphosphate glucokinase
MEAFGIDIGGTGIKAAPVDIAAGTLLAERKKILTPQPSTPEAVAEVVRDLTRDFGWTGITGATFPGVVTSGTVRTAANVDKGWIGTDAAALFGKVTGGDVSVLNDADAAGVAEMRFGAGKGERGTVLLLTFGTGVGSALFTDGVLVPNTEFGHIEIRGKDAESRASERGKQHHGWGWKEWAQRVGEYMHQIEALLSPDLIIVGGGISKEADKWVPLLTGVRAKIVPAALQNDAGIVGAALAATTMAQTGSAASGVVAASGAAASGTTTGKAAGE